MNHLPAVIIKSNDGGLAICGVRHFPRNLSETLATPRICCAALIHELTLSLEWLEICVGYCSLIGVVRCSIAPITQQHIAELSLRAPALLGRR